MLYVQQGVFTVTCVTISTHRVVSHWLYLCVCK